MDNETKERVAIFKKGFLSFDLDAMEGLSVALLDEGVEPRELLALAKDCIEEIGAKFEAGEYYLPELVISGEIFKTVSEAIKTRCPQGDRAEAIGVIVLGTPLGDIHSLGKDIFGVLAEANGFVVHDLGVDVHPDRFVEKVIETKADILGLSALLTSTYAPMREILAKLEAKGVRDRVFVSIGGSATTKDMVERLKVDAQSWDAYESVQLLKERMACKRASV